MWIDKAYETMLKSYFTQEVLTVIPIVDQGDKKYGWKGEEMVHALTGNGQEEGEAEIEQ